MDPAGLCRSRCTCRLPSVARCWSPDVDKRNGDVRLSNVTGSLMPGPKTANEAREWIAKANAEGRLRFADHFEDRLAERQVPFPDAISAIRNARQVEAYPGHA